MIQITKGGAIARLAMTTGLAYLGMSTTLLPHGFTVHQLVSPSVVTPSVVAAASAAFLFMSTAWAQAHNQPAPAGKTTEELDAENKAKIEQALKADVEAEVTKRMQSGDLLAGIADLAAQKAAAAADWQDAGVPAATATPTSPPASATPAAAGTEGD